MLTVQTVTQGTAQVIELTGRIDASTAPQLDDALQAAVKIKPYRIVVDLTATDFLASAGVRSLLKARQQLQDKNGDLRLAGPSEFIATSLQYIGLDKLLKIYPTREQALHDWDPA